MDEAPSQETPPAVPAWVKLLAGLVLLALAALLAMHLTGDSIRH